MNATQKLLFSSLAVAVFTLAVAWTPCTAAEDNSKKAVFTVDFSDYNPETGSVRDWLEKKGFKFKHDARHERSISFTFQEQTLNIRTKKPAFGLVHHEQDVPGASRIRITWGVVKFPEGASYEHQIDNEAVMLYVFFGHEKMPSGSLLIPDSPYFIGLFLCTHDRIDRPYKGHHFKQSGRFVCLGHPAPGETMISEFNLEDAFKNYFGKDTVPAISGLILEVDTTKSDDHGHAAAFIKSIELKP